jgi:hypothetical protein
LLGRESANHLDRGLFARGWVGLDGPARLIGGSDSIDIERWRGVLGRLGRGRRQRIDDSVFSGPG